MKTKRRQKKESSGYWLVANPYPGSRGLTLLEVAIWVVIFTLSVLTIMTTVLYFYRTNTYTINQASAVTSAQRGVEKMIRVMREAAYASNGAYPIVAIGAHSILLYADIDGDPLIERVHYSVVGTDLKEETLNPTGDPPAYIGQGSTTTLSDYVHNLDVGTGTTTFAYYDQNGALVTDYAKVADVRFITVNIIVNVDPVRLPNQIVLRSSAALRNLK